MVVPQGAGPANPPLPIPQEHPANLSCPPHRLYPPLRSSTPSRREEVPNLDVERPRQLFEHGDRRAHLVVLDPHNRHVAHAGPLGQRPDGVAALGPPVTEQDGHRPTDTTYDTSSQSPQDRTPGGALLRVPDSDAAATRDLVPGRPLGPQAASYAAVSSRSYGPTPASASTSWRRSLVRRPTFLCGSFPCQIHLRTAASLHWRNWAAS